MYVIIISGSNHKTKINIGKLLKNCFTSEKTRYKEIKSWNVSSPFKKLSMFIQDKTRNSPTTFFSNNFFIIG